MDRGTGSSSNDENDRMRAAGSPTAKGSTKSQSNNKNKQRLFSAPEDSNARIFITGRSHQYGGASAPRDGSVELQDLDDTSISADEMLFQKFERARPDFGRIVDGVFSWGSEERVAVVVCGPSSMVHELRNCVGRWVGRGREVWFHDEGFGW